MKHFFFSSQQWFLLISGKFEIFQNCHQHYIFLFEQLFLYLGFSLKQAFYQVLVEKAHRISKVTDLVSNCNYRREKPISDTHCECRNRALIVIYPFRSCTHFWNPHKHYQLHTFHWLPGILVLSYMVKAKDWYCHLEEGKPINYLKIERNVSVYFILLFPC